MKVNEVARKLIYRKSAKCSHFGLADIELPKKRRTREGGWIMAHSLYIFRVTQIIYNRSHELGYIHDTGAAITKKLDINIYEYIRDRVIKKYSIPPLAVLITKLAKELNLGLSYLIA